MFKYLFKLNLNLQQCFTNKNTSKASDKGLTTFNMYSLIFGHLSTIKNPSTHGKTKSEMFAISNLNGISTPASNIRVEPNVKSHSGIMTSK